MGGVFIVEDLHCSYWEEFDGGLYNPYSSLAFFKRLVDIMGSEHWGINKTYLELMHGFTEHYGLSLKNFPFEQIHSIEFINSMCIIRKESREKNILGERIISGQIAQVFDYPSKANTRKYEAPPQHENHWSNLLVAPEEQYLTLKTNLRELESRTSVLSQKLKEDGIALSNILKSRSWQMTTIFRKIGMLSRQFIRTIKSQKTN